jgi:ribosomal protein L3 glutamine methyltransferase
MVEQLSHTPVTPMSAVEETEAIVSVRDLVRWGASRFKEAGLHFGHGTDNALDESYHLVLHALHLPADLPAVYLESRVTASERDAALALLRQRIETRKPAAYLLGNIEFCGLSFEVDERVLVPRSPIAELILRSFRPWLEDPPKRVLDLCAGSGCIGIACAAHFPEAQVDLIEIDEGALAVCERNVARHAVQDRVQLVQSDLFSMLRRERYDLIVSNPPYVPTAEWETLAPEYLHEPRLALEAGADGMDIVDRILRGAVDHLKDDGILVCEIGGSMEEFEARFPRIPVIWPEFERGGDGVFVISRSELRDWRRG